MFREDWQEVLQRNVDFALDPAKKGTLLHIESIDDLELPPVRPLEQWDLLNQWPEYLEACIQREKAAWEQRRGLEDDTLPVIKPYFGIAEHTAFVGGRVEYGGNTSYHVPVVEDLEDLSGLSLREENENFRMLLGALRYVKKRAAEEGFLPMLRGAEAPLDMANAIRGNEILMDFYDDPDGIHRLMEFCLKACRWTLEHQLEIVGGVQGGTISGIGIWMPGRSVGHLAEDLSSMCSPEIYRTFGLPYTQRLLEGYDCAVMHTHTMGRHVLPDIAGIEKIRFIQLGYDPNQPTPIEVYREYESILQDKIVIPTMSADQIEENLDFLAEHKSIVSVYAKDRKEAEKAAALVKTLR